MRATKRPHGTLCLPFRNLGRLQLQCASLNLTLHALNRPTQQILPRRLAAPAAAAPHVLEVPGPTHPTAPLGPVTTVAAAGGAGAGAAWTTGAVAAGEKTWDPP